MSLQPIDLTPPDNPNRKYPISLETDKENFDWVMGVVEETKLSRSLLMHRILTSARLNIGIATVEGERRRNERRSA